MNLIQPIKQPSENLCWYTALLMLSRWRDQKLSLPTSDGTRKLEQIVLSKDASVAKASQLFAREDIADYVRGLGMDVSALPVQPVTDAIKQAKNGPFAYLAVFDAHFQHTLVIADVVNRHKDVRIQFVDPEVGKRQETEYYDFMLKHPPAWNSNRATIVVPLIH